jgi:K+/H+ antiporter YhaU regulatory subunit KhtT
MGGRLAMEELPAPPKDQLYAKVVTDLIEQHELRIIVLGIRQRDGKMIFNPRAETRIERGDFLIVLGEKANLEKLERTLA